MNPSILGILVFGPTGLCFIYCFFQPQSRLARAFLNSARYPQSLGRYGFLIFAAVSVFLVALALKGL